MKACIFGFLIFSMFTLFPNQGDHTRYILIEAPCKAGFNALPKFEESIPIHSFARVLCGFR